MITVYGDAPEENKELKERGKTDAERLYFRAVGEPRPPAPEAEKIYFLSTIVYI